MDSVSRRPEERNSLPHRGMRDDKPATPRYDDPARARPRHLPAHGQNTRRGESSERESSNVKDDTIGYRDRDRWRYGDKAREVIPRRRPTDESISQQARIHHELAHVYGGHNTPGQTSIWTADATGIQPPFGQALGAFQSSQVLPPNPPIFGTRHEASRRGGLVNTQMPVYPTSNGNQEQRAKPTKTTPALVTDTETTSYFQMFARLLTWKPIEVIKEAKQSSNEETPKRPQKQKHPSSRRSPTFGTQWIDFFAPRARSNWPIEGWPYIPTLAFLDAGSRGNVNSVSQEYLEEKLNMTYTRTDDTIRGHEQSFTPLGIVKIEFHPIDINEFGECEADLPVTLSFYVHSENDLFGQILLGREYMRSRATKMGQPTYKETMKPNPEEQKVANEKIAKRDAASQRVWDANNNNNPPSGNNGSNPAREQGTYRHP